MDDLSPTKVLREYTEQVLISRTGTGTGTKERTMAQRTDATKSLETAKYVRLVQTLVSLGRPLNRALHDVASSYALPAWQVKAISELLLP